MKKLVAIVCLGLLISCSSGSQKGTKPLCEVLSQQADGGARISFFELLTEVNEIKMLQNDPQLRKKINENELSTCNFVILNAGEKETSGFQFSIEQVSETQDSIVIQTKLVAPKTITKPEQDIFYTPFTVLKINSKKPIQFK